MNQISLSNSLQQIEFEIQHHKNIAGQSIWEIGRRLNHVKENDLAHGEFMKWLDKIEMEHTSAKRMMKIADEIPKSATLHHLGESALYLISSLPEEQKEKELSKAEQGEASTIRELRELRRTLKEKNEQIKDLENKEPEVIEKEVIKKELPFDYSDLKSDNQQLEFSNRRERDRNKELTEQLTSADEENEYLKKQLDDLLNERAEVDEKSRKYDELTEGIHELEGKMNAEQKRLASYTNVIETVRKGNQFLDEVAGLIYATDIEEIQANDLVVRELNKLIERTYLFADDLSKKIKGTVILEEEYYQ